MSCHAISYLPVGMRCWICGLGDGYAHLQPVAYAEDRYAQLEYIRINMGCIVIVHGIGRSGENDAYAIVMSGRLGVRCTTSPLGFQLSALTFWVHGMSSA